MGFPPTPISWQLQVKAGSCPSSGDRLVSFLRPKVIVLASSGEGGLKPTLWLLSDIAAGESDSDKTMVLAEAAKAPISLSPHGTASVSPLWLFGSSRLISAALFSRNLFS